MPRLDLQEISTRFLFLRVSRAATACAKPPRCQEAAQPPKCTLLLANTKTTSTRYRPATFHMAALAGTLILVADMTPPLAVIAWSIDA